MSSKYDREIPNSLSIEAYLHCGQCLKELPADQSPSSYARYEVGWTPLGFQVWCARHNCNIVHVDFRGQKVGVNTTIPFTEKNNERR